MMTFDRMFVEILYIHVFLGPSTWCNLPGVTIGDRQSPIDIIQAKASFDESLKSLQFSYPNFEKAKLNNNGHTIMFEPGDDENAFGW